MGCRIEDATLTLQVERGMSDGDQLTFKGLGEQQPQKLPGDVVLTLRQRKHPVFDRSDQDLHMEATISLKEALLGFERQITHLDDRRVTIGYAGVSSPGGSITV